MNQSFVVLVVFVADVVVDVAIVVVIEGIVTGVEDEILVGVGSSSKYKSRQMPRTGT